MRWLRRPGRDTDLPAGPGFSWLCRPERAAVARLSAVVDLPAGFPLARAGEPAREVFLVLDGALGVTRDHRALAVLGAGSVAGELGVVLRSRRRQADLVTLAPTTLAVTGAAEWKMLLAIVPRLADLVEGEIDRRLLELDALDR